MLENGCYSKDPHQRVAICLVISPASMVLESFLFFGFVWTSTPLEAMLIPSFSQDEIRNQVRTSGIRKRLALAL